MRPNKKKEDKIHVYSIELNAPAPAVTTQPTPEQEENQKQQRQLNQLQLNLSIDRERAINAENWSRANYNNSYAVQLRGNAVLNGMLELRLALNIPRVESSEEDRPADPANPGSQLKLTSVFDDQKERDQLKKKYAKLMDIFVRIMETEDPNNFKPKSETKNENKEIPDNKGSG